MKHLKLGLVAVACALSFQAQAQISGDVVRIGVLTDLTSGYSDYGGEGHVLMAKLAAEDMGGSINGKKIEVIFADFQHKADVSLTIARKWFDQDGVDIIIDAPNSGIAASLQALAKEKNKIFLAGAASSDLSGKYCTPNSAQFLLDTYALGTIAGNAMMDRGSKSWFAISVDNALGQSLERDAGAVIKARGGAVISGAKHPLNGNDMSSVALAAQASRADTVMVASMGNDVNNVLRALSEYGVDKQMKVTALGLELVQVKQSRKNMAGVFASEIWYWDQSDENRAFAKRYSAAHSKKFYPSRAGMAQYGGLQHYLRAVKELNNDTDGRVIMEKMKSMPVDNVYSHGGKLRADGRFITTAYLAQVKTDAESKGDWDLLKIVGTVPGDQAFKAPSEECPLNKK